MGQGLRDGFGFFFSFGCASCGYTREELNEGFPSNLGGAKHATSVRQGCRVSLRISPGPCATQEHLLLLHPELGRNQLCSVSD